MIDELAVVLEDFPGVANHACCFTHILNLVTKSVMKQSDLPKARVSEALDAATQALATLGCDVQ